MKKTVKKAISFVKEKVSIPTKYQPTLVGYYILLGAHELRARRTMCKSVFFFNRHKLLTDNRGLSRLKEPWSRRFGNPAGRVEIIEKR
jgi:hypothetical protein